jgi:SulP family sulfate permease
MPILLIPLIFINSLRLILTFITIFTKVLEFIFLEAYIIYTYFVFNKEKTMKNFEPKILLTLKNYDKKQFIKDITAGLIVAIVALPLSIAFGIASGVAPQGGLITAVIAGFIISLLGGSRVQIGGPTGAFIIIVYGVVQQFGIAGLTIATIMAGFILILMGVLKIGSWIRFVSAPLVTGFTSGIALIIFSTQVKDFFGLTIDGAVPAEFIEKWITYFENFSHVNYYALLVSAISISIIILCTRFKSKIPGPFLALLFGSSIAYIFDLPVETIGDRFGEIHFSLNTFAIPHVEFKTISILFPVAITIALLGAIESLLSAVV